MNCPPNRPARRFFRLAPLLFALGALAAAGGARAHEIPADVLVQAWVQPANDRLTLLVRVPLAAMRDVVLPLEGPGYLDIGSAEPVLRDAATVWIANGVGVYEDGRRLPAPRLEAVRLSLPSDRSFRDFEAALAHVDAGTLPDDVELVPQQALLDARLSYAIADPGSDFAIDTDFRRLGLNTTTVIGFLPPGGAARLFRLDGDPGLVQLDPRWHHAVARFIGLGFAHILDGTDHLLFVLCLVIPFRRIRPLIAIVTSFTVAHSITLIGSALGLVPAAPWFPALIETLIAASIVYMALENIVGARWERRWVVAFGFGLVHGFGFSFALNESLQFAGGHLLASLFAFNLGVELGQLLIVALAVPLLALVFRLGLPERLGTIILSALLAHSGWHWMSERAAELMAWRVAWPGFSAGLLASWMRFAMLLLIIGLALWLMFGLYRRLVAGDDGGRPARPPLSRRGGTR